MFAELAVTDGTADGTINLLNRSHGFHVVSWRPALPGYKGGGVFQDSPLAHGRRLVTRSFENVVDTFSLAINAVHQNALIYDLQELARLLEKGVDYWAADWQNEPVWLEARAIHETNTRYAIVHTWRIPELDDPYRGAFISQMMGMDNLTLIIEHGLWLSNAPGESTCVEISAVESYCWPPYVELDAATTNIVIPDNAVIQDLHDAAMTAEAWIRAESWGESGTDGAIIGKNGNVNTGWRFFLNNALGLRATIDCAIADGSAWSGNVVFTPDSLWHHVAFTWDDATYNNPRLWIDGVEQTNTTAARNGAIVSDIGNNLLIGNSQNGLTCFDGGIGWCRVSDIVRYTATFTPPARCTLPAVDGNTVLLEIQEGIGATTYDQSGNDNDGAITAATWGCDCSSSTIVRDPECG